MSEKIPLHRESKKKMAPRKQEPPPPPVKLIGWFLSQTFNGEFQFMKLRLLLMNIIYSPFTLLCGLVLCWYLLYTQDLTSTEMTGYVLLNPRQMCGHTRRSLHFPGTFSHNWVFTTVRDVLSVTFIPDFMIYVLPYTYYMAWLFYHVH